MNYDDMLTQEQYKHDDRPLNDDKVWCVFVDEELFEISTTEEGGYKLFDEIQDYCQTKVGRQELKEKIELGWVYENDFDYINDQNTYRLLNVVETYKK